MKKTKFVIVVIVAVFIFYNFTVYNGLDVQNDTEGLAKYFEDIKNQEGQISLNYSHL